MSFTGYLFLPFVLLSLVVYFLLPLRTKWIALLVFSIFFFCTWGIDYLPLVLIITLIAWAGGKIIDTECNKKPEGKHAKKAPESAKTTTDKRTGKKILLIVSALMILKYQSLTLTPPLLSLKRITIKLIYQVYYVLNQ